MVDLKKAKEYLRIDYDEDDEFIRSLIAASKIYLENAIGTYKPNELTDLAQLILIIFQIRYCSPIENNESGET